MLKCYAAAWSLRASPLNWALVAKEENAAKTKIFRATVRVFWARFSHFNF